MSDEVISFLNQNEHPDAAYSRLTFAVYLEVKDLATFNQNLPMGGDHKLLLPRCHEWFEPSVSCWLNICKAKALQRVCFQEIVRPSLSWSFFLLILFLGFYSVIGENGRRPPEALRRGEAREAQLLRRRRSRHVLSAQGLLAAATMAQGTLRSAALAVARLHLFGGVTLRRYHLPRLDGDRILR